MTGEVVAVNEDLDGEPEKINADPYGEGWIARIRATGDTVSTMSPDEYQELLDSLDD